MIEHRFQRLAISMDVAQDQIWQSLASVTQVLRFSDSAGCEDSCSVFQLGSTASCPPRERLVR